MGYDKIFKNNNDGTIVQIEADLLWSKNDSRQELAKWLNWDEAKAYAKACNEQKYLGYSDWRLPAKSELRNLFKNSDAYRELFLNEPKKIKQVVSNYKGGGESSFWTCETRFDSYAWKSYFPSGKELCVDPQVSTTGTSIRLVRDL